MLGVFVDQTKLYRYVKKAGKYVISKHRIRKWLQRQEAYSLQRPLRRKFKRNRVIAKGIDDQWDADLMDMTKYSKDNDGYSYILLVIDIFSKFLLMRPLKNKKGESVSRTFTNILTEGRRPPRLRTDKGQEFRSRVFNDLLKDRNIEHLYAQNTEIKANYIERVIKTMMARITRYMTYKQSYRYIDHLPSNHRHGARKSNEIEKKTLWWKMYWPKKTPIVSKTKRIRKPFKFKMGDKVRASHIRTPFTREYDEKWSGEIFIISERRLRGGLPVYKLKDYMDEEIKGSFYQSELQKIEVRDTDAFKVEKILKTKGRGHNKQYFVKWLHFSSKFNSWVKEDDVQKL